VAFYFQQILIKKNIMTNKKNKSKDTPYREHTTRRSKQTGDIISDRNNNMNTADPTANEPNVERANDLGLGDAAVNDKKLTRYKSNRSTDA
jgi:hypothetical protein